MKKAEVTHTETLEDKDVTGARTHTGSRGASRSLGNSFDVGSERAALPIQGRLHISELTEADTPA